MNDNYVMYNGKKLPFPKEWEEMLKEEEKKDIFARAREQRYFYISGSGKINHSGEIFSSCDDDYYDNANYCTDKEVMKQRALHEILNRRLWRFSEQNGGSEINWRYNDNVAFIIYYSYAEDAYKISESYWWRNVSAIYFKTYETAQKAIEEIIKPFFAEHPEFKW